MYESVRWCKDQGGAPSLLCLPGSPSSGIDADLPWVAGGVMRPGLEVGDSPTAHPRPRYRTPRKHDASFLPSRTCELQLGAHKG